MPRKPARFTRSTAAAAAVGLAATVVAAAVWTSTRPVAAQAPAVVSGVRDVAWSPDGRHLAVSLLDRLHLLSAGGRAEPPLVRWSGPAPVERDPAWSPDGEHLAFAADAGEGFDLYVVAERGGHPTRVTFLAGDERWPSWTRDGRLVFSHRRDGQWDLFVVDAHDAGPGAPPTPIEVTNSPEDEVEAAVSPDGALVAFVSNRETEDGDLDLWVMPVPERGPARPPEPSTGAGPLRPVATRVVAERGTERRPAWAPGSDRLVFSALRGGVPSLWVASADGANEPPARPTSPPVLVSRRGGAASWSPDGLRLVVAEWPDADLPYNGEPARDLSEPPPLFALGEEYRLRTLPAPRPPDAGTATLDLQTAVEPSRWVEAFDRVWSLLARLYYRGGRAGDEWLALRERYRPQALAARNAEALEAAVDALVADQPLVRAPVRSKGTVVVSGHPLATEAGLDVLARGGNVVDAAVAVSFALGVVEPDASGIGGDGMALVWRRGMSAPVVIDFKDQTPMRATLDNPRIFRDGRLVADGPAAANIPGVVAGMAHLHGRYGSGRVAWADLLAPAIRHAAEGFVLDDALPASLAAGRGVLEKYREAARIFLPGGRVPRAGERFVNRDYAATLEAIAAEGASAFYRGRIAQQIEDDMAANGGILTAEDLAQYRAIEREPLAGRYRRHTIYAAPPPVATGVQLIEMLQILDHYEPAAAGRPSADADLLHFMIESWKARHPVRRVADPALWPVDLESHLERAHAGALFKRIEPRAASRFGSDVDDSPEGAPPADDQPARGTTAFVVADADGNLIVVTQTLSTWGGNFYVSKGLGFLYNNHLRSNRTTPGAYGQLLPLMRQSSTSAPTIVFEGEGEGQRPRLAVGAAGNAWILASVYSAISGVIDGGLGMQAAIEAPRFVVGRNPADPLGTGARVQIEDRFARDVLDELTARGHVLQKIGRKGELRYGYAAGVLVDYERGEVEGGADPRRSYAAGATAASGR